MDIKNSMWPSFSLTFYITRCIFIPRQLVLCGI